MTTPKSRVLLVDDEPEFTETLAERLELRGLAVDVAATGEAALEKARARPFDAVFLDLSMPGMDGIETLARLREQSPDAQVIVLSGRATVRKSVEAMQLGALDVLEKPVDINLLVERIEEAATRRMLLTEQRVREETAEILRKRGW